MTRDFARLTNLSVDVVVVGGGIHGLFAAYDAAQRGLSTVLLERDDFGAGISFNHQRTIHGGLRALQSGDVRKCREMIRERRAWARMAPHLVRPLPFLIGTYRGTTRARTAVRLGLKVFDWLGRDRNDDVLPELHLPKGRLESAGATRRLFPGINETGLSGGAIWYDYQTIHPDRLTWCVALAAERAGATLCNYAEVTSLSTSPTGPVTVTVRDRAGNGATTLTAGHVVLAAGSGVAALTQAGGLQASLPPLVRAMNVLLDRPARDIALAARAASGRMYTLVPWRGALLAGTWQAPTAGRIEDTGSSLPPDFLSDINSAFPALAVNENDVRFVHDAMVPAATKGERVDLLAEPIITRVEGAPTVILLVGVKYTTARLAAARAIDMVPGARSSRTDASVLPHADVTDSEGLIEETSRRLRVRLDRDVHRHLASWYGDQAAAVVAFGAERSALQRLSEATPVIESEVLCAAQHGSVVRLSDIVFRRTALASAGSPGEAALTRAAELAGSALGWSNQKQDEELADVLASLRGYGTR